MSALKLEIIKCFNEEVYEQINKSKKYILKSVLRFDFSTTTTD